MVCFVLFLNLEYVLGGALHSAKHDRAAMALTVEQDMACRSKKVKQQGHEQVQEKEIGEDK